MSLGKYSCEFADCTPKSEIRVESMRLSYYKKGLHLPYPYSNAEADFAQSPPNSIQWRSPMTIRLPFNYDADREKPATLRSYALNNHDVTEAAIFHGSPQQRLDLRPSAISVTGQRAMLACH